MLNAKHAYARGAALALVTLALPTVAHADETSASCNAAYEDADSLVRAGGTKLLDARDRLRVCVKPSCKAWMVKECTKSLSDVEARIPSVVFVAKDVAGHDVIDVTVTADDKTVATRLDGRAVEIGPGERTFVFVHSDGRRAMFKAVVKEGEKAQRVTATLEAVKPAAVAAPPPVVGPVAPVAAPAPAKETPLPPRLANDGSAVRTTGFVLAGAGVVGLAVGTIFGIKAVGNKSDAKCDAQQQCDPAALSSARSSATVATISFIAGGLLAAGGVTLIVIAPPGSSSSARLEIAPAVAHHETGFTLRGLW